MGPVGRKRRERFAAVRNMSRGCLPPVRRALPLDFDAHSSLMGLQRSAELAVVVEIRPHSVLKASEIDAPASVSYWLSPIPCTVTL